MNCFIGMLVQLFQHLDHLVWFSSVRFNNIIENISDMQKLIWRYFDDFNKKNIQL
jgi:hypothetical protein